MKKHHMFLFALACIVIMATACKSAAAHITANPNEAEANGWFRTALRVSHGCAGSSTIAVQVTLPDGAISVRPQVKPGWTIDIKKRALAQPIAGPHGPVTEVVEQVTWRGGPLPDAYFDEFGLAMKLPNRPGETLYFPTVQECEDGENRWTEIPAEGQAWGDVDKPAPFVRLKGLGAQDHSKH